MTAYVKRTGDLEGLHARHPDLHRAWTALDAVLKALEAHPDLPDMADVPGGSSAFCRWAAAVNPAFVPAWRTYLSEYSAALKEEGFGPFRATGVEDFLTRLLSGPEDGTGGEDGTDPAPASDPVPGPPLQENAATGEAVRIATADPTGPEADPAGPYGDLFIDGSPLFE
jgi:hypothetical protein